MPPEPAAPDQLASQRAAVLRTWRERTGLLQATVAHAAGVSDAALSAWERGERGIDLVKSRSARTAVQQIGARLGAPDALPGLWAAVGTVAALPVRSLWQHNFAPAGGPCWAWVRSPIDCQATAQWGIVQGRTRVPGGSGGLLVHFPASVHNPPLQIALGAPGWVDTGLGTVPPDVAHALGAQWVDATTLQVPRSLARLLHSPFGGDPQGDDPTGDPAGGPTGDLGAAMQAMRRAAGRFRVRWDFVAPHAFDSLRPASPAYPLDGTDLAAIARADPPKVDGRGGVVAQTLLSGMGLQTLRNARGFSRQGAAEEVTALDPGEPCTRGSIQRLEDRGQLPRTRLFLARLDTVYSGGGRAGLERVRSEPDGAWRAGSALRRWRVEFPPWWVGPIWLQPVGPAGPRQQSVLHLIWGPWARRQRVTSGLVATTRKAPAADGRPASDPLYAGLPAGWHLIAGVGAVPTALDVGDGWRPRTVLAALRLVGEALRAVEHAPAPGREPSPG